MPLILGANSLAGGYQIKNSARFNSGSSDYLNRTPASASTSDKILTYSTWIKRSILASSGLKAIFFTQDSVGIEDGIQFWNDRIDVFFANGGTYRLTSTAVYRDVSAWYHIFVAIDTTQATSSNRVKLYVNGTQVTAFDNANYPTQNYTFAFNKQSKVSYISNDPVNSIYFDGYMSDVYLIDGQALTPSSFGETDEDTGIWKPKAYTGSFGTNGFYLDFEDSANLGNDMSGNNNDFTVNNLTSIDQTTDTPTNNFATFNSLIPNSSITYSEGNLSMAPADGTLRTALSTIAVSSGKWYAEFKIQENQDEPSIGVVSSDSPYITNVALRQLENSTSYRVDGIIFQYSNSQIDTGEPTFTTGDIIGVALDMDNSKVYFSKNGTFINSANPANGTNGYSITSGKSYYFGVSQNYVKKIYANFGNPPYSANSYTDGAGYGNFSYSVPSGFYSLCTKNLYQYGF